MSKKNILKQIKDIAMAVVNLETTNAEVEAEQVEASVEPVVELEEETPQEAAPEVPATPEAEVEPQAEPVEVVEEVVAETPEYATRAELNEAIDNLKSLFSAHKEKKEAEITELKKQLDNKPDAEAIKPTPKVELATEPAASVKGRLYQFLNNK